MRKTNKKAYLNLLTNILEGNYKRADDNVKNIIEEKLENRIRKINLKPISQGK